MPAPPTNQKPLSETALQVAELYAALYPATPARTKAMQWLNTARKATTGAKGINSAEVSQAIEELVAADILEPSIEAQRGVAARGPCARIGLITHFCKAAHKRGVYRFILREFNRSLIGLSYRPYHRTYEPEDDSYIPEELLEQYARHALISDSFEQLGNRDIPMDCWLWLVEHDATQYMQRLPQPYQAQAISYCLAFHAYHLQPIEHFAKRCRELGTNDQHELIIARAYVFKGEFKRVRKLLKTIDNKPELGKNDRIESSAIKGLIASLEGDDASAMQHIQATLDIERSGTRKRIVYADTLSFGMSLFSLIRLATPESRALFEELMQAREKLKIESDLDWPLAAAQCADQRATPYRGQTVPGRFSIISVLFAVVSRWHKDYHYPDDHVGVMSMLDQMAEIAHDSDYLWAVAELHTVMEASVTSDELGRSLMSDTLKATPASKRHEALGTRTLTQLVTVLAPWEYSLRDLEQLAVKAKPAKAPKTQNISTASKRLIWRISETHNGSVEVSPIEQSLGKKGDWSQGRRVALKRLKEQADSMPHLSAQDVKAGATIQKLHYGWGESVSYETNQRTTFNLAGHPCIFDVDGERYDIVEQAPVLSLTESGDCLRLSLTPTFGGQHYKTQLDRDNRRVYVTHFTAGQRRIAEALPNKGLVVPNDAGPRLQKMLDGLSAEISIQGDSQSSTEATIPGSAEPILAMEPFGQSLRVRIRVEPLPESNNFFDAGIGGSVVYIQSTQGTVSIQRDLTEERNRVEALVMQSEALAQHYDGRTFFVVDDTIDALELLEELQSSGVRCIWPSDIPFKIAARADVHQVNLNIKSAKEWFNATGTLHTDDEDSDPLTLARVLELMQAQPQSRFIELKPGDFLSLSRTLKQQLDTLQAYIKPASKPGDTQKLHPMALLSLDPLLDKANVKSDTAWKKRRQQVQEALETNPTIPAGLQADLRPYQFDGFVWLERLGKIGAGACLADDMGLGKTIQSLALFLSRAKDGPALVVAPTSVVGNWLAEAQRFAPTLKVRAYADSQGARKEALDTVGPSSLLVVSYGLMVNDIEHLQKIHWNTIVLDEAQAIKNANTRRAKCARELQANFRVVTTGTPVQNNLMDLHSLYSFLNPQLLGTETAFRKRFALPIAQDNDEHARNQLQQLASPFLLRRHKRDVLNELPARTELTLNVALSKEESTLYDLIRQEALECLDPDNKPEHKNDNKTANTKTANSKAAATKGSTAKPNANQQKFLILAYLTKLRRLCCNPSLVAPEWSGPMSKLDVFSDTLLELISSGHKALVFSQFVDHLKIVESHIKSKGVNYQYLDGSTSAKQRTQRVDAFQAGEGDVFLISLTAGGTGLNLTAADYVIHLDPWWNPAVEDQASDRAHRMGQQRPVTIVRMVTTGTIEEQIQKLHASKRELADSVLSGADSAKLDLDTMIRLLQQ